MIRLALAGGVEQVRHHVRELKRRDRPAFTNSEVTAIVCRDAGDACEPPANAARVSDLATLIGQHSGDFDALVVVQSDQATTVETQCLEAIGAGKHLLLDWSLVTSGRAMDRLIQAAEQQDVRLMAGNPHRYEPGIVEIRGCLDEGRLGIPGALRIHRWDAEGPSSDTRALVMSRAIQELDLACWLFGTTPSEIFACAASGATSAASGSASAPTSENAGYVQIHLGFRDGGMALIDYSSQLPRGDYYSLTLVGSSGTAHADDHHNMPLQYSGDSIRALRTEPRDRGVGAQLDEFLTAIQEQRSPASDGRSGRASLVVASAVCWSLESRRAAHRRGADYELV